MLTQLVNLSIKSSPAERCEIPTRVLLRYQEHVVLGQPSLNGDMPLVAVRAPGVSGELAPRAWLAESAPSRAAGCRSHLPARRVHGAAPGRQQLQRCGEDQSGCRHAHGAQRTALCLMVVMPALKRGPRQQVNELLAWEPPIARVPFARGHYPQGAKALQGQPVECEERVVVRPRRGLRA